MLAFEAFFKFSNFWYNIVGYTPYDDIKSIQPIEKKKIIAAPSFYLKKMFYLISVININLVLLTECAFVVVNFLENADFIQAARNLTFVGYVIVSDLKIWSTSRQRTKINFLIHKLYEFYPKDASTEQIGYNLEQHLVRYKRIGGLETISYIFTVMSHICAPMLKFFILKEYLQLENVERDLPFYCWVPFEWRYNWLYYPMYVSQVYAAISCLGAFLGYDLLMCAAIEQLIIHFGKLARDLECYKANGVCNAKGDLEFLSSIVAHHQRTLELSNVVNEIFGVTVLLSLSSNAFIICFLAFQYSVGVQWDALIMLLSYMICSMSQIYMICSYGQELVVTSENVGHAVYNHDWRIADIRYKKMLALIIQRAQKPAMLKATTFLDVSMGTMTDLLQLSYKFFAVIRTMYAR